MPGHDTVAAEMGGVDSVFRTLLDMPIELMEEVLSALSLG